jgi:hypothetical protein
MVIIFFCLPQGPRKWKPVADGSRSKRCGPDHHRRHEGHGAAGTAAGGFFFHSRHTEALAKINRDCSACHMADEKGRLSPKFKRLTDTDRQAVTDTYHINCIACHRELAAPNQKSGPQTCGGCHQENPAVASTWKDIPFDKSLHYRHVKANAEKCESCHHAYDKQAKRLVYAKGQEGRLCLLP